MAQWLLYLGSSIIFRSNIRAETIFQTNDSHTYANTIIQCPDNDSCRVICSTPCTDAVINCPADHQCDISCPEFLSCQGVTMNLPTAADPSALYSIDCSGQFSCHEATFNWPEYGPKASALACTGHQSCQATSAIVAPPDEDFTFECHGASSCVGNTIVCPSSHACSISCGSQGCASAAIICPASAACSIEGSYDGDSSNGLRGANITCPAEAYACDVTCSAGVGVCGEWTYATRSPTTPLPTNFPTEFTSTTTTISPTVFPTVGPTFISQRVHETTWAPTTQTDTNTDDEGVATVPWPAPLTLEIFDDYVIVVLAMIVFFAAILCVSCLHSKCIRNNFFSFSAVFASCILILDVWTDVVFAVHAVGVHAYVYRMVVFACSVGLTCLVCVVSLVVQHYAMKRWRSHYAVNAWMSNYATILQVASILCGSSLAVVQLCRSNAFNLNLFELQITTVQYRQFAKKLMFPIVVKNLCLIVLQIGFLVQTREFAAASEYMVFISLFMSLLSILYMLLLACRLCSHDTSVAKLCICVEFDINVYDEHIVLRKYRHNVQGIAAQLASLLCVDRGSVEFTKPDPRVKWLHCALYIYLDDDDAGNKQANTVRQTVLYWKQNADPIAQAVRQAWKLPSLPFIQQVKCTDLMSDMLEKSASMIVIRIKTQKSELPQLPPVTDDEKHPSIMMMQSVPAAPPVMSPRMRDAHPMPQSPMRVKSDSPAESPAQPQAQVQQQQLQQLQQDTIVTSAELATAMHLGEQVKQSLVDDDEGTDDSGSGDDDLLYEDFAGAELKTPMGINIKSNESLYVKSNESRGLVLHSMDLQSNSNQNTIITQTYHTATNNTSTMRKKDTLLDMSSDDDDDDDGGAVPEELAVVSFNPYHSEGIEKNRRQTTRSILGNEKTEFIM